MAKDFYISSYRAQKQNLKTARTEALYELERAKQFKDKDAGAQAEQTLADLWAAERNLEGLANEYWSSQQPPPELSPEEKAAKPIERMDYRDAFELAQRGSKYGVDVDAFNEGLREVARRRARGE